MNVYAASDSLSRLVACSRLVGQPFCDALVQSVAEMLNVSNVLIARISAERPGSVRTVSAWSHGSLVPNFEYDLTGSPCQQVMVDSTCHYSDGVADLFPADRLLFEMGARSYIGTPLLNSEGRAVGVLAAISDAPLEVGQEARALFEIFAGRVAAELERDSSVSRSEYLGRLIDGSASEIYVFDAVTLRFVLVNEGARANLGYSIDELETMTPLDLKPDFTSDDFSSILDPLHLGSGPIDLLEASRPA
jgi:PAS domain-containing protein